MSNSNNLGKELKRLRKEFAELDAQGSKFHFVVGDANESAEAKLERLKAEGAVQAGDKCQLVDVPWAIHELKGSTHIPEGNPNDPLAEPPLPSEPINNKWAEQREREERWAKHLKQIKRDGQLYEGDKKPDTTWR